MTPTDTTPAKFADHFSSHAADYARFRPTYPSQLFDWIAGLVPARTAAWDCGCGNGQATIPLAERFDFVFGTDPSAEQIALAPAHPRIRWSVAPAEGSGLESGSVDAVTIAQALHWFDLPRFWKEVRRVARPGAAVVAWSYGIPFLDDAEQSAKLLHLHDDVVGPYWPIERGHVGARYQTLDFPFDRITPPPSELTADWTLAEFAGYLQTWSATRRYIKEKGTDPIPSFAEQLRDWWGERRVVRWPLTILAGRIGRTA